MDVLFEFVVTRPSTFTDYPILSPFATNGLETNGLETVRVLKTSWTVVTAIFSRQRNPGRGTRDGTRGTEPGTEPGTGTRDGTRDSNPFLRTVMPFMATRRTRNLLSQAG